MKRKSSRITSSTVTSTVVSSATSDKASSNKIPSIEKPKSSWYYLGSDRKKSDDAPEPSSSSILSHYQGLALSLPTSLSSSLFSPTTTLKWDKPVQQGDYGPVYVVSRDIYGYYDDNDNNDNDTFYGFGDHVPSEDPICKVFIGSDLLIEPNILNIQLSDLRKM